LQEVMDKADIKLIERLLGVGILRSSPLFGGGYVAQVAAGLDRLGY